MEQSSAALQRWVSIQRGVMAADDPGGLAGRRLVTAAGVQLVAAGLPTIIASRIRAGKASAVWISN